MKIILTGSQGTGKSTLAKILSSDFNLKMIDSVTAEFAENTKSLDDFEFFKKFQTKVVSRYSDLLLNTENYVSSRGFADVFAYSTYKKLDKLADFCKFCQSYNDAIIFYVPIKFGIESKPLRSADKGFQNDIDKLILEFLNETNTSYYTIETLSVDDRINEIKGYLNEYF